jgi:hypothetical protein
MIGERVLEENNTKKFKRIAKISRERAPTEEAGRLLIVAERQRLLKLNVVR